ELCRVGFYERNADQVGGAAYQESFAHAGGADENNILLGVVRRFLAFESQSNVVIMVAQRHAQDFFSLVLLDDKAVEVRLDVPRLVMKSELLRLRLAVFGFRGARCFISRRWSPSGLKMLADKVRELPLKFLRRGRAVKVRIEHDQKG